MSNPRLPLEILDYIVDLLHDEPETLGQCCLVSKSWVSHTRKHLFVDIDLRYTGDLEAWKETFPDPMNSPAYHARSLSIGSSLFIIAADAEEDDDDDWIRAFSRVVRLEVRTHFGSHYNSELSLVYLHNFSPVLKSFQVDNCLPRSRVFNLVCSLPLLEDLIIHEDARLGEDHYDEIDFQPLTSPLSIGTFELDSTKGTESIVRRLLDLPGGFHFRKLVLTWRNEEDLRWIMALVGGCSDTLECFDIKHTMYSAEQLASVDFSKATRLRHVTFWCKMLQAKWIVMALQTITSKHQDLQRITIHTPYEYHPSVREPVNLRNVAGEARYKQWMVLDDLLVRLLESHAIPTKVTHGTENNKKKLEMCEHIRSLLPKIAERGTIRPGACGGGKSSARSAVW